MKFSRGKLIVIEGTDGSGKKTQAGLLVSRLKENGYKTATLSFPQYGKKSAGLVEEYLNGKYGRPKEVNPHAASLFYAVDRFDISKEIRELLSTGHVVILDRYVDSNAGHQGGKIKNPRERAKFLKWLYEIEYKILGIPKPDLVIILHVPAETGYRLIYNKQPRLYIKTGTRDAHESDMEHLKNAEASYLWLAKNFPKDHKLIECVRGKKLLSPEEINVRVWDMVEKHCPLE